MAHTKAADEYLRLFFVFTSASTVFPTSAFVLPWETELREYIYRRHTVHRERIFDSRSTPRCSERVIRKKKVRKKRDGEKSEKKKKKNDIAVGRGINGSTDFSPFLIATRIFPSRRGRKERGPLNCVMPPVLTIMSKDTSWGILI